MNFIKTLKKKIRQTINKFNDWNSLKKLDQEETALIKEIKDSNLTYLSNRSLAKIANAIKSVKEKHPLGLFIEAGCALGGSTILISKLKNQGHILRVYDVFEMIPSPTEEDTDDVHERYQKIASGESEGIGGDLYYGYEDNLYEKVISNLAGFDISLDEENVKLIKGLLQDTLEVDEPVVFAHIDVDWYDPVKTCLQRIWPLLVSGGVIILDDYFAWGGCTKAVDEFFKDYPGLYEVDDQAGTRMIKKI